MATARPIDEKIVAMKMDNSDFVKKASETTKLMGGLTDYLNKIPGINFGKTTRELQNIQRSVNGIETSRLSSAIDTVTSRFSTLGIVGTTALVNITNRAVDAGMAMVRNLTVAPVLDGFREYELKMGSIQTILANTARHGTGLNDVTDALQELNLYADKTIYNFGQMTKNIGLFTNAGLELEESVSMIRGFANAAAASGAGAMEMARAAYQLSQGLASGYIMTMDWMSLTNAGMGNDNMRRDLIALGQAMGTLNRTTEDTLSNWKESLSDDRWLTKEVFSNYLQAMAGDLDKATLLTIGLTEAQANLLLQNAKTGEEAATYVRTFTQMMSTLVEGVGSGWSESWEIIFGDFENATKLWTGFSELISEPFNKLTESRNNFLKSLKDQGVFEEMFVGLGTVIYIVGQAISAVASGFDSAFSPGRMNLISIFVKGFKNFVSAITPSQETLDKISTIFQAIGSNIRVLMNILGNLGGLFLKLIPDNLGTNLLNILENLARMNISFNESVLNSQMLRGSFENLGGVFSWIGDRIGDIISSLSNLGRSITEMWTILSTGEAVANGTFDKDSKIVAWLIAVSDSVKSVITNMQNLELSLKPVADTFDSFFSAVTNGFNWLKDKLSGIGEDIQASMPSGTTLFAGGFVAALVTISGIVLKRVNDITKIFSEWGNVVQGFAETLDSVSGALDAFALNVRANALLTASIAVGALAVSVLLLSRINGGQVANSLVAIVGSLTAVIGAMAIMNKYDVTGGIRATTAIIGMAVALSVMSTALKKFGSLKPDELTRGLIGVVTVMAGLAGSFALMGKFNSKDIAVTATQIVAMSVSVMLIAKAVKDMGSLNLPELSKGIGGLAAIVLALSSAFLLMGKFGGKGSSATALQFVAIAGSVLMLVGAIKTISSIETSDLLVGLGTITAILSVIAGFATLTSGKGLLGSAAGLLAISVAMNALIIPIFALGNFPMEKLGIGLLGLSGALLAIGAASKLMSGSLAGVASIMAMSVALNLLLVPIGAFAAMGWGPMLTGVAGLALSLGALAGVSLLLAPATVPLLGFSAAIALMGVAMLAAGAGMTLFSTGLVALAGLTAAAITTIITTLGALITGLTALIPSAVKFVANIIKEVAIAIRDNAPGIISVIAETIVNVLTTIASYVPQFAKAAVKIITTFLNAIAEEGPKIVESVVNLLITMVETMAKTIEENGPRFINAFLDLMGSILDIMVQAGTAVITALYGWIPGVEGTMNKVATAAEEAIDGALETARIGEEKGSDFADGIASKISDARKSGEELSASADDGLKSVDSEKTGENFVSRFISGILGRKKDVQEASSELASAAEKGTSERLDIRSPSKVGETQGEYYGEGVAIGIDNSTEKVKKSADDMSNSIGSGLSDITEMVRDKLFIKDKDVKENERQVDKVSESYSDLSKEVDRSTKSTVKSQKDGAKKIQDTLSEEFKKSKQWIDDRKYYQELSLEAELAAWQRVQKRYLQGSEERRQADREVFRVQQEIIKQKEEAEKAAFNRSRQFIEDEKTFKKISLMEELSDWQRVQQRYLEGTEERKQADREVLRIKNEINQRLMSLNDEYIQNVQETNRSLIEEEKRLNEEYQRTYDDRVRSLTNFVGLFDKVRSQDPENPLTGAQLVENLRDQVNSFATWSDDIQRLAQKGIDEGLLKELEAMGPSAALEIAALNDLTSSQLDQYVELWRRKNELARTQASKELEPLREETNRNIEALRKDTEKQLEAYRAEWVKKVAEIRVGTKEGFVGLTDDMNTIGSNAIEGLMEGMSDKESPLYSKVREIAKGIEQAIKETLKIQSPSRVMMGLGEFAGEGLAVGLSKASGVVGERSKSLALKARDSINKFLSRLQIPDFDNNIHFKAVLDDSDIMNGSLKLNNTKIPYYLGTTNGLISSARASFLQNGNKTPISDRAQSSSSDILTGQNLNRPIIIQSILNGRVIAEETFNDIDQLMSGRTNLDYAMKGV